MDRKRILLVEDNEDLLQGLRIRLRASGYETLIARDGSAELEEGEADQRDRRRDDDRPDEAQEFPDQTRVADHDLERRPRDHRALHVLQADLPTRVREPRHPADRDRRREERERPALHERQTVAPRGL